MSARAKYFIIVIIFLLSSKLLVDNFYGDFNPYTLIVCIVVLLITYPLAYYFDTKSKSKLISHSDDEILKQTKADLKLSRRTDAKE